MRDACRQTRPRRRGFGLIEMAVAGVLFGAMAVITVQLVAWVATDRQATSRRAAATRVASNVMERVLAHPWSEITTEALAPLAARPGGPEGNAGILRIEVKDLAVVDGRGQKQVIVSVAWPDRAKVAESPVRLVAWTLEWRGLQP